MKISSSLFAFAVCLLGLTGCKQDTPTPDPPTSAAANDHGHEHAEGNEGRDHSVAGHGHGAGPHGGTIADWGGGKYHVELTVNHDQAEATVYVLGSDEKTPAPIDADSIELSITEPKCLVTLAAAPQNGDPEGEASRFIGTHDQLSVVREYAGTMTGLVEGTPYSGDFDEDTHDH